MNELSSRAEKELRGVHPALVAVIRRAWNIKTEGYEVIDGLRTLAEQKAYVARGVSKTLKSYHLPQEDGFGHAADIVPWVDGVPKWPNAYGPWKDIERAMKQAAKELNVPIEWGGDWKRRWDKPHWQIPRRFTWSKPKPKMVPILEKGGHLDAPALVFDHVVARGAKGELVVEIQKALHRHGLGLSVGRADGDFGPKTEHAVKAFRAKHLLVDGVVDAQTWAKLFETGD